MKNAFLRMLWHLHMLYTTDYLLPDLDFCHVVMIKIFLLVIW